MSSIGVEGFPLFWPDGWNRTPRNQRRRSRFKTNFGDSVYQTTEEIRRLGCSKPIISTNVPIRRDGLPYSNQREPDDPGVAVYFTRKGQQQVIACDSYDRVGDNIHAVMLTIQAMRAIQRHGATTILDRAFKGFAALPPVARPWTQVFGLPENAAADDVEAAYRQLVKECHPDRGGSAESFFEVQHAWQSFTTERGIA